MLEFRSMEVGAFLFFVGLGNLKKVLCALYRMHVCILGCFRQLRGYKCEESEKMLL